MKTTASWARPALALSLLFTSIIPASARPGSAVQDGAHILSQSTVTQVNQIDDDIYRATGKDILVVTEPSVSGNVKDEANAIFRREGLNGVLIFMVPEKRVLGIVPGRDTQMIFPRSRLSEIRESMVSDLKANRFDEGILEGAQGVRSTFLSANPPSRSAPSRAAGYAPVRRSSGFGFGSIFFILLLLGGFSIFFMILRGFARMFGGAPQGGYAGGAPGYAPGPGYGYGAPPSSGGGFLSNLAAGVGGAVVGNALYDTFAHHNSGQEWTSAGNDVSTDPGWAGSDAGVAGTGDFSSGFDGGGGGGDWGGGGGDWS
jgi:uncharacterized membrane protein YgcG